MSRETSPESASLERQRMASYTAFSRAFSYPDQEFLKCFPELEESVDAIRAEYDTLFRRNGIWLYSAEYTSTGDSQRINELADIMGFYRAFGLRISGERPDALSVELEFMHFLIFKALHARDLAGEDRDEKAAVCREAQQSFYAGHLYPGARAVTERILCAGARTFYGETARELMLFLGQEQEVLASTAGATT